VREGKESVREEGVSTLGALARARPNPRGSARGSMRTWSSSWSRRCWCCWGRCCVSRVGGGRGRGVKAGCGVRRRKLLGRARTRCAACGVDDRVARAEKQRDIGALLSPARAAAERGRGDGRRADHQGGRCCPLVRGLGCRPEPAARKRRRHGWGFAGSQGDRERSGASAAGLRDSERLLSCASVRVRRQACALAPVAVVCPRRGRPAGADRARENRCKRQTEPLPLSLSLSLSLSLALPCAA
jgi:hypothetical protein